MYINCHSNFSLKRGTLSVKKLVQLAAEKGITQLALTDVNNTSAGFDFLKACKNQKIQGVVGIEFRDDDGQLLYVGLPKNQDGFQELSNLLTKKLKDKVDKFYVPLGIKAHLTSWGVDATKITEFDWWENINFKGVEFISAPARHFSGRGITNRNSTLWCSWVLKSDNSNIFFSGDSGYGKHFKEIGEKYGPFDFAMVECGQYNEQWSQIHMTPEETIQASIDVKSSLTMPIHWGSFKLALHSWDDPIIRVSAQAKVLNVKITTPKIGEAIVLSEENYPSEKWWLQ